jgi:hypothetical protein
MPFWWFTDRTIESLSITRACRGNLSEMEMPGQLVEMGQ